MELNRIGLDFFAPKGERGFVVWSQCGQIVGCESDEKLLLLPILFGFLSFFILPSTAESKRASELASSTCRALIRPLVSAETCRCAGSSTSSLLWLRSHLWIIFPGGVFWLLVASRLLIIAFDCRQTLQLSSGLAAQVFWFFFFGCFFWVFFGDGSSNPRWASSFAGASKQTWLTRRRDKAQYSAHAEQLRVDVVVVFVGRRKSAHVLDASLIARDHVGHTAYRVIIIIIIIQRAPAEYDSSSALVLCTSSSSSSSSNCCSRSIFFYSTCSWSCLLSRCQGSQLELFLVVGTCFLV
jgi:hypothetical protein